MPESVMMLRSGIRSNFEAIDYRRPSDLCSSSPICGLANLHSVTVATAFGNGWTIGNSDSGRLMSKNFGKTAFVMQKHSCKWPRPMKVIGRTVRDAWTLCRIQFHRLVNKLLKSPCQSCVTTPPIWCPHIAVNTPKLGLQRNTSKTGGFLNNTPTYSCRHLSQ